MVAQVILKPGKERSLLRAHPWVFSGAIARAPKDVRSGETVAICRADGRALALASYSPSSQIRARVLSFDPAQTIDASFFEQRLSKALLERELMPLSSNAYRWVHGEADGLPGLIVDRYGDVVVAQFLAAGAEAHKAGIAQALLALSGAGVVYERSDADVRALEGLASTSGALHGELSPGPLEIEENGLRYLVDIRNGHKTGFYLDQRDSRALLAEIAGERVLNCFCYTGGFSLAARRGGAKSVLSIDSSGEALALARANWELNGFAGDEATWLEADVFAALRELRDRQRQFDTIVLDPPKFAPTAGHVERAARAYKDINLLAIKLLADGGRLMTFSCSGGVSIDLFQKIVAGAAADAHVEVVLERRLGAGLDHPVRLAFPEGEYLKGLVLRRAS
jgi:23S rRNA (cytosine1962-C5)-methyltransferase